jgi:hypothetical protein
MKNQAGKYWLGWCVRPKMLDWLVEAVEQFQTVFVVINSFDDNLTPGILGIQTWVCTPLFHYFTVSAADQSYSLKIQLGQGLMSNDRITSADLASTNSTMFRTFTCSHALRWVCCFAS